MENHFPESSSAAGMKPQVRVAQVVSKAKGAATPGSEPQFKVAQFKKLDWKAVEGKLIRRPSNLVSNGTNKKTVAYLNASGEISAPEDEDKEKGDDKAPPDSSRRSNKNEHENVNWGEILPRLRKSLVGLNVKSMKGMIWPLEENVPITRYVADQDGYNMAALSPRLFHMNHGRNQERQKSPLRNKLLRD